MTELAILDAEQALYRLGNHHVLYSRLLALFEQQAGELLAQLENNQPITVLSAHTLKGSAAEIGAEKLRRVMQHTEQDLKANKALSSQQLAQIKEALSLTQQAVITYQHR